MSAQAPSEAMATLLSARPAPRDWRRAVLLGYVLMLTGFGGFVGWAMAMRLDGAVIAPGVIAAETNRKTIQHLEGGIVRDILVRDGETVRAGQVLVRLDPTRLLVQRDLFRNRLAAQRAQEVRLGAELAGAPAPDFPPDVLERQDDPEVAAAINDQKREFATRQAALAQKLAQAESQIEQARNQIEQNDVSLATARATLANVEGELEPLRPLFEKKLIPVTRIRQLERENLRLTGEISGRSFEAGRLADRLSEMQNRRRQLIEDAHQESAAQLTFLRRQMAETRQSLALAEEAERRIDIVAPTDGTVQELRVFTIGGVVRAGEAMLDIVPSADTLVVRAKVAPVDADRIVIGMAAELRFPAFRYFGVGAIGGAIRSFSRDRIVERDGAEPYFAAEIAVDRASLPDQIAAKLTAGMPAEVIVPTGERTVLDYLMTPITERFNRSMRER